jgi:hypothetical protein
MSDAHENPLEVKTEVLDQEWVRQPELYYEYAVRLADARLALKQSQQELEVTKAELDTAIRSSPANYGLNKVTEGAIESTILLQDEYQLALKAVHKAQHKVDILSAYCTSLEHKKRALEKLVDLHLSSYFASPKGAPRGSSTEHAVRRRLERAALENGDD